MLPRNARTASVPPASSTNVRFVLAGRLVGNAAHVQLHGLALRSHAFSIVAELPRHLRVLRRYVKPVPTLMTCRFSTLADILGRSNLAQRRETRLMNDPSRFRFDRCLTSNVPM